jgi:transposase
MALSIVRTEHSADALRDAARAIGMERQTLRDWVIRYNGDGIEGLHDRPRSGRPPRLVPAQMAELAELVEDGPELAAHGVVRWRCADLAVEIQTRFDIVLGERQIERILKQLDFTRLSVRPRHPKADEAAQQTFKKTSPPW